MKKILLIAPNYRKVYKYVGDEATMIQPPLGLAYIAAVLRKNDFHVKILDAAALNLENSDIKKFADAYNPEIVGMTAATNTIELAYEIAKTVKNKNNLVVVGGPHTSLMPEETLKECRSIDIAIKGEGEYTLLDLAKGLPLENIKGITYRKKGKIIRNQDRELIQNLDELPFPARDLLPLDKYWSPGVRRYPFATLVTSRGCPYNCTFCVNYTVLGKKFRHRSVENVMKEIDELVSVYGVKEINILDDNFTVLPERAEKICDELIKRKYDLIWKTGNGIRADRVSERLIKKMKKAGCYLVAFGIESGNEQILKKIEKGETLKQIEDAVRWSKKYGLITEGFFIIGNQDEGEEEIRDTINFAKKLDLDIAQFQIFIPLPGSKYTDLIEKEGKIFARSWRDYNAFGRAIFRHRKLTPELMERMQKLAYREYYLRPKMILRKVLEIRSFKQLKAYISAGLAVLKFRK